LDGGVNNGGVDTLIGGAGNDTYFVRNAGDVVTEAAGNGIDTVMSAINTYTLGTNLENLTFIGSASFIGSGNTLANVLTAGVATGQLTGGAGADTFVVSSGGIANRSVTITDFSHTAADQITLSGYGLGAHLTQTSASGAQNTQYAVQSGAGATLDQFQLSNKAVLVTGAYHFA
jgi:Ca2+-binding RTX toxin-like protein